MFKFKNWLEATQSIINVGRQGDSPETTRLHDTLKSFIEQIKDIIQQFQKRGKINWNDFNYDFKIVIDLISKSMNLLQPTYKDKKVYLPSGIEDTYKLFSELIEKLNSVRNYLWKTGDSNNKVLDIIKWLEDNIYPKLKKTMEIAKQGHGQRYTSTDKRQQKADQISLEVRDKVSEKIKVVFEQMLQNTSQNAKQFGFDWSISTTKINPIIKQCWELIQKELKKPLAFSALKKESTIYSEGSVRVFMAKATPETITLHKQFLAKINNFTSLLQTPRIWKNTDYVSKALKDVDSYRQYPELFRVKEVGSKIVVPHGVVETIKAFQPLIKLLPNFKQHVQKDAGLVAMFFYLGQIWEELKKSQHFISQNASYSPTQTGDITFKIKTKLDEIRNNLKRNIDSEFPTAGKNRDNYLKAIDFYFNRIKGALETI